MPTHIVLSHEEQRDRLRLACPEAVERVVVAGDPCLDRLIASIPLRETYRQAFGLAPAQRLIVVSTTWGGDSLLGKDVLLPQWLARRLPIDDYRIALALHPNITQGHSPWQVKMWLDDCVRAGVLVLPGEDLWRPALIAADLSIGDHGSVLFYSACLGTPVLFASTPEKAVASGSPIAALMRVAPRLSLDADPQNRIEEVIAAHQPGRYAEITDLATSAPGKSAELLRDLAYETLRLTPPLIPPPVKALPAPEITLPVPKAQAVEVLLGAEALVSRYPVDGRSKRTLSRVGTHLVVGTDEPDIALLGLADVVLRRKTGNDADEWITATLQALPGCRVAATKISETEWRAGTTDGLLVRLDAERGHDLFVSVLHEFRREGRPLPRELQIKTGTATYTAAVTLLVNRPPRAAPPAAP